MMYSVGVLEMSHSVRVAREKFRSLFTFTAGKKYILVRNDSEGDKFVLLRVEESVTCSTSIASV